MNWRLLLLVSLLLVAGFAPAPFPRMRREGKEQDDLQKFQGTWVVLRYEYAGRDTLPGYREKIYFRFQGKQMTCLVGNDLRSTWSFELSPTAVPRAVTKTMPSYTLRGIYRFEGDKLIVCESQNDQRPTAFDSRGRNYLIEMRKR